MNPPTPEHLQEWRDFAREDWWRMRLHLDHSDPTAAGMFLQQVAALFPDEILEAP